MAVWAPRYWSEFHAIPSQNPETGRSW